ncbi:Vacuole morphology and inheritance protein 14 [Symbiodinium microadriaticum]|uniref:Vacuole morphology and inheritance protein 14 n=1 Tax=Symbiodinium microadriaticum TaxID=2951 RepID=A0A1Q9F5J8_SYMMI|nr:Vacuole morphology and inheritance protein 14 [Symbiodinium microadriaticum]
MPSGSCTGSEPREYRGDAPRSLAAGKINETKDRKESLSKIQARVQQTVLNDGYEEIKKMIDLRRKKHGRAKVKEALQPSALWLSDIMHLVIGTDTEQGAMPLPEIRYLACESLFNIAKVANHELLPYIPTIFDGISRLFADVNTEVRHAAMVLDKLLRDRWVGHEDIVTSAAAHGKDQLSKFPAETFVQQLGQRHNADNLLDLLLTQVKESPPEQAMQIVFDTLGVLASNCQKEDKCIRLCALCFPARQFRCEANLLNPEKLASWLYEYVYLTPGFTPPGKVVAGLGLGLRLRAQRALGVGKGRLFGSAGSALDGEAPVKRARLQNAEPLTFQVGRVATQATEEAFATILGDGSVVTWGRACHGGVVGQLKNVQQIQATSAAFAAILVDGSVVTWARPNFGGDSSDVRDQLKNVQQIQATDFAFAAILGNGDVVTWGDADCGGDSSAVQDQLKNVQQIQSTRVAFAAMLGDGSIVTWGDARYGGDSSAVQDQLKTVQQIQSTRVAFAAILGDGSVVTWGFNISGDSSSVRDQLKNVQQIQSTEEAFAVILRDGSVVTWGQVECGGDSSDVRDQLKNVQQIQATSEAFAAILVDGSVVTWGRPNFGGDSSDVRDQLKNVQQIQATHSAFAAILGDGSVVTWGDARFGGNSSAVRDQLSCD